VLLALAIISTVTGVVSALSGLGLLPQRRRPPPQTVVIVVTSIETPALKPQTNRPNDGGPELESVAQLRK
jgi:hypothetical protein